MKKLMLLLLCICMAFGACFALSSCTNDPPASGSGDGWDIGYY